MDRRLLYRSLRLRPCATADELHTWVQAFLRIDIPRRRVCPKHAAPFDYLRQAYFEPAGDLAVWAPRGGGKTRLAAIATLLDLLHKPGIAVRLLGGSLEQSLRIWDHLLPGLDEVAPDLLCDMAGKSRRIALANGSNAAVLTQSQRSVRGLHVQKLRCDEVELFDPEIWEAAQLVPRSTGCGGVDVSGAIEAISTMHNSGGLMQQVIDESPGAQRRIVHWCLMEVLERCPAERECGTCPLWNDCEGRAKTTCDGFFRIDDAIRIKQRVSLERWQAEMRCLRPGTRGRVFGGFDEQVHVREALSPAPAGDGRLGLGMDFGYHNPFVCLWIVEYGDGRVHVIDEYVQSERPMPDHIEEIGRRRHGRVELVACDPAGSAPNEQTAKSNVALLRAAGLVVRSRGSQIQDGLERIRAALRPAAGEATLFVHPRCRRLIAALRGYRYPARGGEVPSKTDGHDHAIDALRYWYVNRHSGAVRGREY